MSPLLLLLLLVMVVHGTCPLQLLHSQLQLLGCVCCCLCHQAMDPLRDCRHREPVGGST
jgi:hypothetical protein